MEVKVDPIELNLLLEGRIVKNDNGKYYKLDKKGKMIEQLNYKPKIKSKK